MPQPPSVAYSACRFSRGSYPLYPRGPSFGSHSGHMGGAGLSELIPRDEVSGAPLRVLGPVVGNLIAFDV